MTDELVSVVGILPALGSGLTDLARSGQHERLLDYDLRAYAQGFDRVRYFSYCHESLDNFTTDAARNNPVRTAALIASNTAAVRRAAARQLRSRSV